MALNFKLAEIILESKPDRFWKILKQIGVNDAVGVLPRNYNDWRNSTEDKPWDYYAMMKYRNMLQESGLNLIAIEDNPPMNGIMYGNSDREKEIDYISKMIENMGKLNIKIWCYNWMAGSGWSRTKSDIIGKNGEYVSGFDYEDIKNIDPPMMGKIGKDELWKNLKYFLDNIIPVAKENDVKLAMHPDDPPIENFRGIDRIMNSIESYDKLLELNRSKYNGITLCQGNFTLMTDDLPSAIRHFNDRIFFVHFRDVNGNKYNYQESLINEGRTDMAACMKAYNDINYSGIMRVDHTPTLEGDSELVPGYSYSGRIYSIGYIKGLIDSISRP